MQTMLSGSGIPRSPKEAQSPGAAEPRQWGGAATAHGVRESGNVIGSAPAPCPIPPEYASGLPLPGLIGNLDTPSQLHHTGLVSNITGRLGLTHDSVPG
jgi:hypothetical protein